MWRVPVGGPELWGRVLANYDRRPLHLKFVAFCRNAGCLDYAARRYRARLDADPDDSVARDMLAEIEDQALAGLVPVVRKERRRTNPVVWVLFVALMLGILWGLLYLNDRLALMGKAGW